MTKQHALLFPGQGAQYIGMGKDFYDQFPLAKNIFEEANDILQKNLSKEIFSGEARTLTETKNAQPAIFVTSYAILQVVQKECGLDLPVATAGLSLGEYTALAASGHMSFSDALKLVQKRGELMHEACEKNRGKMAVVIGLSDDTVQNAVNELQMPNDIWAANFNCPGQVVISGTEKGIEKATEVLKNSGAKRILPLQVHGAFHSGLMQMAKKSLEEAIKNTTIKDAAPTVYMNAVGDAVKSIDDIRQNLADQVISPVYWHKSVSGIDTLGIDCFIEIGPGKTLQGMNKRIGVKTQTISIEKVEELKDLS